MKYGKRASFYHLGRPSYPKEAIDLIFQEATNGAIVADIGAGTGKLTLLLAQQAKKVYAVEPDDEMRKVLVSQMNGVDNVEVVNASAEDCRLPDNSVDIICTAQAFHWFDTEKFCREINRILRKNGKVFILHNSFPDLLKDVLPNKNENSEAMTAQNSRREQQRRSFWDGDCVEKIFDNTVSYDREQFLNYYLSFSTTPICDGETENHEFDDQMEAVHNAFDRLCEEGKVKLPFVSKVYTGKVRDRAK